MGNKRTREVILSGTHFIVSIEKLVAGGLGLARTDKGIVFVHGAAPGDVADIVVTHSDGGMPIARIECLQTPSSVRAAPICPLFGTCGGCNWQHISYKAQVDAKVQILQESLTRLGHLTDIPAIERFTDAPTGYRIRGQIKIDRQKNALGFFRSMSNEVVPVANCPLFCNSINAVFAQSSQVCQVTASPQIQVITGSDGSVASSPVVLGLTQSETVIEVAGRSFVVQGSDFFQSNGLLLEKFGRWGASRVFGTTCIDLYGGTGFFSVLLAENFKRITLIDVIESQIIRARQTFARNGISHIEAIAGDAGEMITRVLPAFRKPDCLIIDPPRVGLDAQARESIGRLKPRQILSVSCNPATHGRDLGYFVNQCGYTIKELAFFDLYPHTHHIESVALLSQ